LNEGHSILRGSGDAMKHRLARRRRMRPEGDRRWPQLRRDIHRRNGRLRCLGQGEERRGQVIEQLPRLGGIHGGRIVNEAADQLLTGFDDEVEWQVGDADILDAAQGQTQRKWQGRSLQRIVLENENAVEQRLPAPAPAAGGDLGQ
jgi:hypothetical protein